MQLGVGWVLGEVLESDIQSQHESENLTIKSRSMCKLHGYFVRSLCVGEVNDASISACRGGWVAGAVGKCDDVRKWVEAGKEGADGGSKCVPL